MAPSASNSSNFPLKDSQLCSLPSGKSLRIRLKGLLPCLHTLVLPSDSSLSAALHLSKPTIATRRHVQTGAGLGMGEDAQLVAPYHRRQGAPVEFYHDPLYAGPHISPNAYRVLINLPFF